MADLAVRKCELTGYARPSTEMPEWNDYYAALLRATKGSIQVSPDRPALGMAQRQWTGPFNIEIHVTEDN